MASEYVPYLCELCGDSHIVYIHYYDVPAVGIDAPQLMKNELKCEYLGECKYTEEDVDSCPIFIDAPKVLD